MVVWRQRLCTLGLVFAAAIVSAQDAGKDFLRTGTIDELDLGANRIVIDDMEFLLSDSLVVRAPNGAAVSRARLRTGISVGYNQSGERLIAEIRLLPFNRAGGS